MAILKTVFAENYASFADRVEFTCESAGNKKDHSINTVLTGDTELNLVSYIYGANGSGKSYFCRIFQEIKQAIALSSISTPIPQNSSPFKNKYQPNIQPRIFAFDTAYANIPTKFGLELILNDTLYHYEFSVFKNEIINELLQKKKRRTETILRRTSPDYKDIELKSELKNFNTLKYSVRKDALCLAIAASLNNPFAIEMLNAIWKLNIFNMATQLLDPPTIAELFSKDKVKKYTQILRHADPTLEKIEVKYLEEKLQKESSSEDFENRDIIENHVKVAVKTEHSLYTNGKETKKTTNKIRFFEDESLGTVKLFTTLPYLFDVLEKGDVLILDEIENGLHPNVVKEIINLFLDKKQNPHQAQLICTTHQPLLLYDTVVKRDQVWVISKNKCGKSTIARLSEEPSTRSQSNLSNKIIEGALGCNPKQFFS